MKSSEDSSKTVPQAEISSVWLPVEEMRCFYSEITLLDVREYSILRSIRLKDKELRASGDTNPFHNPLRVDYYIHHGFDRTIKHLAQECKHTHTCSACKNPCQIPKIVRPPHNWFVAKYGEIHDTPTQEQS